MTNHDKFAAFYILTEEAKTDIYLLKIIPGGSGWLINDIETSIAINNDFYHYKLIIDRTTNKISLSIYSLDDDIILENQIIEKSASATSSEISKFFFGEIGRGYFGTVRLNNISVYTYENALVSPIFTQRPKTLSLENYLNSITNLVGKSNYCLVSFSGKEITVTSKKEEELIFI